MARETATAAAAKQIKTKRNTQKKFKKKKQHTENTKQNRSKLTEF